MSRDQFVVAGKKKFRAERGLVHFPQPAESFVPAREHSFFRPDEFYVARFEFFHVLLRRGMRPHFSVHRRRDQNRRAGGERDGRERMTRQTMCELGDYVRSSWRDQHQVPAVRKLNVARSPAFFFVEETRHHRIFRQRLQRERRNKFGRVMCHHHENFVTLFDQQTRKLWGFVRGDGSSDAKHNRFLCCRNRQQFSRTCFFRLASRNFFYGSHIDQIGLSRLLKNVSADMMLRTFSRSSSTEPLTIV